VDESDEEDEEGEEGEGEGGGEEEEDTVVKMSMRRMRRATVRMAMVRRWHRWIERFFREHPAPLTARPGPS